MSAGATLACAVIGSTIGGLALLVWGWTYPVVHFFLVMAGAAILCAAGVLWLIATAVFVVGAIRVGRWRLPTWLLIPPILVLVAGLMVVIGAPLEVRWAASEPAFRRVVDERAVDDLERTESRDLGLGFDTRLGGYRVRSARQQGDAVIFTTHGGLLDEVGFAYLPSGPFPELESGTFERPDFWPMGGDWYAWTASW